MKRLILTALLLGNALAASASTVNWGAATASSVDSTQITSGKMYLLWADKGTHIDIAAALSAGAPYDIGEIKKATGLTQLDSFGYDTETKVAKSTDMIYPSDVGGPTGVVGLKYDVDFYQILIGSTVPGDKDSIAFTTDPTTVTITISLSGDTVNYRPAEYSYGSVPEPTSGLLLVLGVAGLALRRKRTERR